MLTLSSAFTEAVERSGSEFIYVVEIWTGTANPLCTVTGSRTMTFSNNYNYFTGDTDAGLICPPGVANVTQINTEIDPFQRTVQHQNVTVAFHDDGRIRDFLQTTRLTGQTVVIKLGTYDIAAEADWAPVFRGIIETTSYRDGAIDIDCRDNFLLNTKPYWGNWINAHPLEAMLKVLQDLGFPAGLIDEDSFDPTDSDYEDVAHYVCTYFNATLGMGARGNTLPGGHPDISGHMLRANPVEEPIEALLHSFAKALVGSLYAGEDGIIKFSKFDPDKAVVANWDEDDIDQLNQGQTIIINEIDVSVTGQDLYVLDGQGAKSGSFVVKDSASQANFALPGEDIGVFSESTSFQLLDYMAHYGSHGTTGFAETGSVTVTVVHPWGLSGCRVRGDYTFPGPWNGHLVAGTTAAVSRPCYFMLDEEVIKCTSISLPDTGVYNLPVFTGTGGPGSISAINLPAQAELTFAGLNRGNLGTTAAAHNSSTESDGKVLDITMAVGFAKTQLNRFSNGCNTINLTTNLSQWAVQVGDLVTVTHDSYVEYKFDGLSTNTKWEVVGKELRLDDKQAEIHWNLAYAGQASSFFPDVTEAYDWTEKFWTIRDPIDAIRFASEAEVGISRHVVRGFDVSSSGLNVTIGTGAAAMGATSIRKRFAETVTVIANKDHYIVCGFPQCGIAVYTVNTDANQPTLGMGELILAKIVAGGSTCTITDLREYGAIRPRNLSPTDFEQGANLIPNPDFESWSRGKICPPDNWFMQTLDWIDDGNREETTTYSGNYAVNLGGQYATLMCNPFRVERNRVYQFGGATKPSASSGITLNVGIRWLDAVKATISDEVMFTHTGNTTLTRNDVFTVAPDTAVYASAYCINSHAVDGLYDAFRMVRAMPSFFATNATQTIAKETTGTVAFTTEVYDHGGSYTAASALFTAPFAGVYQFSAQVLHVTNDDSDSFLSLYKNGSLWLRTTWGNGHQINSGPVTLAAGDLILPKFYNDYNGTATLTGDATKCWFSGAQIA